MVTAKCNLGDILSSFVGSQIGVLPAEAPRHQNCSEHSAVLLVCRYP